MVVGIDALADHFSGSFRLLLSGSHPLPQQAAIAPIVTKFDSAHPRGWGSGTNKTQPENGAMGLSLSEKDNSLALQDGS